MTSQQIYQLYNKPRVYLHQLHITHTPININSLPTRSLQQQHHNVSNHMLTASQDSTVCDKNMATASTVSALCGSNMRSANMVSAVIDENCTDSDDNEHYNDEQAAEASKSIYTSAYTLLPKW